MPLWSPLSSIWSALTASLKCFFVIHVMWLSLFTHLFTHFRTGWKSQKSNQWQIIYLLNAVFFQKHKCLSVCVPAVFTLCSVISSTVTPFIMGKSRHKIISEWVEVDFLFFTLYKRKHSVQMLLLLSLIFSRTVASVERQALERVFIICDENS